MRRRLYQALIAIGAALLLGALLLFAWVRWDEARAAGSVADVMGELAGLAGEGSGGGDFEMSKVEVDGREYVGWLEVPALGLELPVMSTWSEDQLRETPCRYHGSAKTGDLVVAGASYESHFGRIGGLVAGDEVVLVDMDGVARRYEVAGVESLAAGDRDALTEGGWDLTLFTSGYDGSTLVCVRCEHVG